MSKSHQHSAFHHNATRQVSGKLTGIHPKLEADEKKAIKKILKAGYKNPSDEFSEALLIDGNTRRYIEDLIYIKYSTIEENQVSLVVVDKARADCIKYQIENGRQGLRNPPIVERLAKNKYRQVTGHHRAYALDAINEGGAIPVILVTRNYSLSGGTVSSDAALRQAIRANKPPKDKPYTTEDVAFNLLRLLETNPTQDGLNPAGTVPPRHKKDVPGCVFDFDDFINRNHCEDTYPWPATRTKIYNDVISGKVRSKVLTVTKATKAAHRESIGWAHPSGKKDNTFFYDTKREAIIIVASDYKGGNQCTSLDTTLLRNVLFACADYPDFLETIKKNNIKFIDVQGDIYKPGGDQTTLDARRDAFAKAIASSWPNVFNKMGIPLVLRYLSFPAQLTSRHDKPSIIDLTKK